MNLNDFIDHAINPGLQLLPNRMNTVDAKVMILAICLQESGLKHRFQVKGPAVSYAQFEKGGGVKGVVNHPATKDYLKSAMTALDIPAGINDDSTESSVFAAMPYNDQLTVVCSRLLLWADSRPLPKAEGSYQDSWNGYVSSWRPGKPHRNTWNENWDEAKDAVYSNIYDRE